MTSKIKYVIVHCMNGSISLKLFDEIEREPDISQGVLAVRLGIALCRVNAYVKRFYHKGYIEVKPLPRNSIWYIITPECFLEKAKLTYDYISHSITYFKEIRYKIEHTYSVMIEAGVIKTLLWGDGEIAELYYISSHGLPIKIVGVVSDSAVEQGFFGHSVHSMEDLNLIIFDAILVTSIEDKVMNTIKHVFVNKKHIVYYLL
ncbi:MarR family transcriptional regulator [Candidatus Magnetobacterium bavaricum]|uniref:MarR family transcriptional regulator n=1 Tax=Candidatus Magnetobacterium bavaricum TaxID=29290 RepID=A0A0F3GHF5_9BACT|nr:MarR family transcriptional regulator [Candidatus Magnetobacterium bavaricum]